jgi:hypothetical protein
VVHKTNQRGGMVEGNQVKDNTVVFVLFIVLIGAVVVGRKKLNK